MVRQWQEMFYQERYSHVDLQASPDFVKLAEAYGGVGMRITRPDEVRPAIDEAVKIRNRPIVLDCVIPTEENVYPMIPSGQSIDEMKIRENLDDLKASIHADSEAWSFSDEDKVLAQYVEVAESVMAQETEA
jgi:acetolactate synthase-1/2/3 large subunit